MRQLWKCFVNKILPVQPLYRMIKDHILERIASGDWRPNQRIPSENEFVENFKISRMTANRALRELADAGYLQRIAGVGTFVADRRVHGHPMEIRNIADEIRERGDAYRAEVVDLLEVEADEDLAHRFKLRQASKLYRSVIVHYENDMPIQLEDRYVNPAIAPEYLSADFTAHTPNEILMQVAPLQQAEHVFRAVLPCDLLRRHLGIPSDEPCLLILRRTWSGGVVASFAKLFHAGSRYELVCKFKPDPSIV